jgi:hypothetical protein
LTFLRHQSLQPPAPGSSLQHVRCRRQGFLVGNERDARAIAATAWFACQRLEALQRKWHVLFKATARAAS